MKHISMYNVKNNIQQINEGIFDGITGFFNTMFQDIVNFTPLKDSVKDSDNRSEFEKALEAAQDQRFSLMEQQREKIEQAKDKLKAELVKTKAAAEQNQIQLKTNKLLDRYNRQINDLKKQQQAFKSNKYLYTKEQFASIMNSFDEKIEGVDKNADIISMQSKKDLLVSTLCYKNDKGEIVMRDGDELKKFFESSEGKKRLETLKSAYGESNEYIKKLTEKSSDPKKALKSLCGDYINDIQKAINPSEADLDTEEARIEENKEIIETIENDVKNIKNCQEELNKLEKLNKIDTNGIFSTDETPEIEKFKEELQKRIIEAGVSEKEAKKIVDEIKGDEQKEWENTASEALNKIKPSTEKLDQAKDKLKEAKNQINKTIENNDVLKDTLGIKKDDDFETLFKKTNDFKTKLETEEKEYKSAREKKNKQIQKIDEATERAKKTEEHEELKNHPDAKEFFELKHELSQDPVDFKPKHDEDEGTYYEADGKKIFAPSSTEDDGNALKKWETERIKYIIQNGVTDKEALNNKVEAKMVDGKPVFTKYTKNNSGEWVEKGEVDLKTAKEILTKHDQAEKEKSAIKDIQNLISTLEKNPDDTKAKDKLKGYFPDENLDVDNLVDEIFVDDKKSSEEYTDNTDDLEDDNEDSKDKKDPSKVWKQRTYKRGDATMKTKSFYNKKGDSISKKEFKEKIAAYKEWLKNKSKDTNDSICVFIHSKNIILEHFKPSLSLIDFLKQ